MIRLTCPSCKSELMIDEGFRGGVCRCFNCGTLMTVPEDPDHQQAESLSRPEAPTGPSAKSGSFARTGTFRTSSGRTVELNTQQLSHIPVAKKRRPGVRAAVYIIAAVMVASMAAIVIYGASQLMDQPTGPDTQQIYADIFGIADNPFLSTKPQFMGAPLIGTTIIMTDGSAAMRETLDFVKPAMELAVRNGGDAVVQVVIWSEQAPIVFPAAPTPAKQIDLNALKSRLDDVLPAGGVVAGPAFAAALASKPTQIVLIARDVPDDEELRSLHTQLRAAGTQLNVVLIGDENPALANIAKETGGKLLSISSSQLRRWYEEYLDKK